LLVWAPTVNLKKFRSLKVFMDIATADKPLASSGKQYHINAGPGDLPRYVLLPGDPDRCVTIAEDSWDGPYEIVSTKRGNKIIRGKCRGVDISACATGMGTPSTAIILSELMEIGCDGFIRVGTCGSYRPEIHAGDLVVMKGAIRDYDGVTYLYAPPDFKAVADKKIVDALISSCEKHGLSLGKNFHVGNACSTTDYYIGQGRPWGDKSSITDHMISQMEKRFKEVTENTDTSIFEMEASAVFTLASLRGVRAGGICLVVADRCRNEFLSTEEIHEGERIMGRVACGAVKLLYNHDLGYK